MSVGGWVARPVRVVVVNMERGGERRRGRRRRAIVAVALA